MAASMPTGKAALHRRASVATDHHTGVQHSVKILDPDGNKVVRPMSTTKKVPKPDIDWSRVVQLCRQNSNGRRLDLSDGGLSVIPSLVFRDLSSTLTELCLDKNKLTSVPNEIEYLKNLENLGLSENMLTTLPEKLHSLPMLRILDLRYNKFTSLPVCCCRLYSLHALLLSSNRLTSIPDEIGNLAVSY